ncbi:MAG: phosphotransferase, partial [Nocardioidaceae bacterium]
LPIGFDLGQLLVGLAHAGELDADDLPAIDEVIFPAYLDGLMADGMVVEPEVVRLGYRASLVARSALTALPLERLDDPLDDALRAHALDRVRLTRRLVDLAPPS